MTATTAISVLSPRRSLPPPRTAHKARALILASVFVLGLAAIRGAVARADTSCPRLPVGLRCEPLPADELARREMLRALDVEGREAVNRADFADAASAFGCLVEADPTPESAGNLAVVLRAQGAIGDALLVARCAEKLAPSGPSHERAHARRLEMERALGLPAESVASPPTPAPTIIAASETREPAGTPLRPELHRGFSYAALALGVTALIGAGVLYALARDHAGQFDVEQMDRGYSLRARSLRDETQTLEAWSWVGGGVGAASLVTGGVLLTF